MPSRFACLSMGLGNLRNVLKFGVLPRQDPKHWHTSHTCTQLFSMLVFSDFDLQVCRIFYVTQECTYKNSIQQLNLKSRVPEFCIAHSCVGFLCVSFRTKAADILSILSQQSLGVSSREFLRLRDLIPVGKCIFYCCGYCCHCYHQYFLCCQCCFCGCRKTYTNNRSHYINPTN